MRQFHKTTGKLKRIVGIGGINCPCCILARKAVTKKMWNHVQRKMFKREVKAEIAFEEMQLTLDVAEWNQGFLDE